MKQVNETSDEGYITEQNYPLSFEPIFSTLISIVENRK